MKKIYTNLNCKLYIDDIYIMMKCVCVTFLLILPSPCQASLPSGFHPCLPRQLLLSLVRVKAAFHYTFDYKTITLSTLSADHNDDEDCKDDDDRL